MKLLGYTIAAGAGAGLTYGAIWALDVPLPDNFLPNFPLAVVDFSYTDFVTVMFAAATLTLAGVALGIGVVAFFTYRGITSEARRATQQAVTDEMTGITNRIDSEVKNQVQELIRENSLSEKIMENIEAAAYANTRSGVTNFGNELEDGFDQTDDGER